jgi:hypothetical protein
VRQTHPLIKSDMPLNAYGVVLKPETNPAGEPARPSTTHRPEPEARAPTVRAARADGVLILQQRTNRCERTES